MSGCSLGGTLSSWCDELLLVVVVLRLSVVPCGQAIGLLAMEGDPPPDCSGQGEGRSFLVQVGLPVVSDVLACVHMYMFLRRESSKRNYYIISPRVIIEAIIIIKLYVCIYICACMCVY